MNAASRSKLQAAEKTLKLAWVIVFGAMLFSVLTVTPLVQRVTADEWDWVGPILPIVVDTAVVIVVRLDTILSAAQAKSSTWITTLRWMTGLFTWFLNIGDSALKSDGVGVAVHSVAPILLIVTSEASLAYRHALAVAVARVEKIEADAKAEQDRRRQEQVRLDRAERERQQRNAEEAERERLRLEVEERDKARDHEARIVREREEREAREREAERKSRERIAATAARHTVPLPPSGRPVMAPQLAATTRPALPATSTPRVLAADATSRRHDSATTATIRPATDTRHEDATAPATGKPARTAEGATSTSERDALKAAIEALYTKLGRRPREGEMVAELERIQSPYTTRQFAQKLRAEIEGEKPALAALRTNSPVQLAGREA
jgi:hypothetical protein